MCYVVKAHYHLHKIDSNGCFVESMDGGHGYADKIISVTRTLDDAFIAMEEYFDPNLSLELYSSDELVDHYYGKRRVEYIANGMKILISLTIQRKKHIPKEWAV